MQRLSGIITGSLHYRTTHISAHDTVYDEEHHALYGVEKTEEPLDHL